MAGMALAAIEAPHKDGRCRVWVALGGKGIQDHGIPGLPLPSDAKCEDIPYYSAQAGV